MSTTQLNQKVPQELSEKQGIDTLPKSEENQNKENSSERTIMQRIDDTPFHHAKTENGEFITFGHYKMPNKKPIEEQIESIRNKDWETILDIMVIMIDINNKKQKQ